MVFDIMITQTAKLPCRLAVPLNSYLPIIKDYVVMSRPRILLEHFSLNFVRKNTRNIPSLEFPFVFDIGPHVLINGRLSEVGWGKGGGWEFIRVK